MWPADLVSNSCFATKPVKISGALCGRVFDPTEAIVPGAALRVVDESGKIIAEAKADSKGDFVFPNLSIGRYRLNTTSDTAAAGWRITYGGFEITGKNTSSCTKPVTLLLGVMACEGGIWKKRPKNY